MNNAKRQARCTEGRKRHVGSVELLRSNTKNVVHYSSRKEDKEVLDL